MMTNIITKELRKWGRNMLPPGMRKNGKPHLIDQLLAIANRIDEELTEQYIALPLDADRVPIHVGDEVIDISNTFHRRGKVSCIELKEDGSWIVFVSSLGRWSHMYRHVTSDTWESIIYDAMQAGRTEETIDVTPLINRCKALVDIKVKEALEDKTSELTFHEDMGR